MFVHVMMESLTQNLVGSDRVWSTGINHCCHEAVQLEAAYHIVMCVSLGVHLSAETNVMCFI